MSTAATVLIAARLLPATALHTAGGRTKIATLMLLTRADPTQAAARLVEADGSVRHALHRT